MENASKALIIAGGVLLAMMILSLVVYVASSMTDIAESEERRTLAEQTAEFNKSYLSYNKSRMYGTDVISVYNKAEDNNTKNNDNAEYKIDIEILDEKGNNIQVSRDQEFKMTIFKCDKVEYSQITGRVKKMTFRKVSIQGDR